MSNPLESTTIDYTQYCEIESPHSVTHPVTAPPAQLQKLIDDWEMFKHPEGGYFKETDRSPILLNNLQYDRNLAIEGKTQETVTRNASTLIYYLLTPDDPICKMHKNKNRIIHILQKGKGQYVLVYPDGRIKSFKVGFDYTNGEVSQWVVPGDVYKAGFVLPNEEFSDGLLISEIVVPGFDFADHHILDSRDEFVQLVGKEKAECLQFLLSASAK